jgi:hypothetical protein
MNTFPVSLAQCRFPLHDLSVAHIFPAPDTAPRGRPYPCFPPRQRRMVRPGRSAPRDPGPAIRGEEIIDATDHDEQATP